MCKHMDDGVLGVVTSMCKIILLKTSCPQLGLLIKTERGFLVGPLAKLFDSLLSLAGLENCNPVHSPWCTFGIESSA